MKDEIKEKDILQKSIECLTNAKLNNTTYEVARDIVLDYITNLQQKIEKLENDKRSMLVQLYKANDEKDKLKEKIKHYEKTQTFGDYVKEVNLLVDYKTKYEKAIKLLNYLDENGLILDEYSFTTLSELRGEDNE